MLVFACVCWSFVIYACLMLVFQVTRLFFVKCLQSGTRSLSIRVSLHFGLSRFISGSESINDWKFIYMLHKRNTPKLTYVHSTTCRHNYAFMHRSKLVESGHKHETVDRSSFQLCNLEWQQPVLNMYWLLTVFELIQCSWQDVRTQ